MSISSFLRQLKYSLAGNSSGTRRRNPCLRSEQREIVAVSVEEAELRQMLSATATDVYATPEIVYALHAEYTTGQIIVSWKRSDGAAEYEVWIDNLTTHQSRFFHKTGIRYTLSSSGPNLQEGTYRIWVRAHGPAGHSQWSDYYDVTVTDKSIPHVTGPSGEIGDGKTRFEWTTARNAVSYDLWVSDETNGMSRRVIYETGITGSSFISKSNLAAGKYRFWVRAQTATGAGKWSAPGEFVVKGVITPQMQSPRLVEAGTAARFEWTATPNAVRYDLWVRNLTTGNDQVIREQNLTASSFTAAVELAAGRYTVWVRAFTKDGASQWSHGLTFEVRRLQQPLVTTMSRNDGQPGIQWESVTGAAKYEVWVSAKGTDNRPLIHETVSQAGSLFPENELADGDYTVWVRASSQTGNSAWSTPVHFTVSSHPAHQQRIQAIIQQVKDSLSLLRSRLMTSLSGKPVVSTPLGQFSIGEIVDVEAVVNSVIDAIDLSSTASVDDLRTALENAGLRIDAMADQEAFDDYVSGVRSNLFQVTLQRDLSNLFRHGGFSNRSLTGNAELNGLTAAGNADWTGDLELNLTFGMDGDGFYVGSGAVLSGKIRLSAAAQSTLGSSTARLAVSGDFQVSVAWNARNSADHIPLAGIDASSVKSQVTGSAELGLNADVSVGSLRGIALNGKWKWVLRNRQLVPDQSAAGFDEESLAKSLFQAVAQGLNSLRDQSGTAMSKVGSLPLVGNEMMKMLQSAIDTELEDAADELTAADLSGNGFSIESAVSVGQLLSFLRSGTALPRDLIVVRYLHAESWEQHVRRPRFQQAERRHRDRLLLTSRVYIL